jgi:hypothetical protein
MECMRCSSRRSGAGKIGAGLRFGLLVVVALVLAVGFAASASAQSPTPTPTPTPSPTPSPTSRVIDSDLSAAATVTNLGSNFLERLGSQSTNGFNRMWRNNPGGGGASESVEAPRFRTWFEGYGISARNAAIGDFVGDRRTTWGGVAGVGARAAPGINVGFTVDQSRTAIDVPLALQSATIDLTQLGFNASLDKGPGPGRLRWCTASATSIRAATPVLAGDSRLQCAARRRAQRTQLLLGQGPEPHRAEGRARICPLPDRIIAGSRRPRSRDGDGRYR